MVIENPAKKNIKNFYLNDYNYFHKNNIRMRHQKMNIINRLSKEKEIERKIHPVPKMLYSTANFKFDYNKKIENIQNNITKAKPMIDDLIHELDNFSISLNSDAEDNEDNKTNKDDFFTNGYSLNNFTAIPTEDIKSYLSKKIRFAFIIDQTDDKTGILIDNIKVIVNLIGSWKHATDSQVEYEYASDTALKVTFLENGDYKVNYFDKIVKTS